MIWLAAARRSWAATSLNARYTHRVAISNSRLVAIDDERVTFRWKDYAHGSRHKTMSLPGEEFLRRFLIHVLPKGLVRIRSYGFLANRCRRKQLALCRRLLGVAPPKSSSDPKDDAGCLPACPVCGGSEWRAIELLTGGMGQEHSPAIEDSS